MTAATKFLPSLLLVMIVSAASAQTGLLLSGDTVGIFRPISVENALATQPSDGRTSSFRIGVPSAYSFQSGAQFNRDSFTNVGDGDTFSPGLLTYFNGLNRIGTSSGNALMDLFLQLNGTGDLIPLTTINFRIDATVNARGQATPDIFRASFVQPEPVRLGDQWVRLTVSGLPDAFRLAENTRVDLGSLKIAAIPEPPITTMLLSIVTFSFALVCRRRSARTA